MVIVSLIDFFIIFFYCRIEQKKLIINHLNNRDKGIKFYLNYFLRKLFRLTYKFNLIRGIFILYSFGKIFQKHHLTLRKCNKKEIDYFTFSKENKVFLKL